MQKKIMTALALFGFVCVNTALADTAIPGTKVSYKVSSRIDDQGYKHNTSMVFVDASSDPSGKTYIAFMCDVGTRLYTNATLGTAAEVNKGTIGGLSYRQDKGAYKSLEAALRLDNKTGKRSSVNIYSYSGGLQQAFLTAVSTVTVKVDRTGSTPVTYTFPVKGVAQALRAVNNCD